MASRTKVESVPCNGCRVCCQDFDAIFLHPEYGDDISKYPHKKLHLNPLTKQLQFILEHQPNGDCIYLDEKGCTIYEDRPAICAKFDCRKMYRNLVEKVGEAGVENLVRKGYLSKEKVRVGKEKLVTLRRGR